MTDNANPGAGGNDPNAAGGQKPWFDGAPPEIVAHLQTHGWDKKSEKEAALAAAQSHFAAQKIIGVPADQLVRIPKDANDADGWSKVYEKLGVPKEYKIEGVKFKDGTPLDQETTDFVVGLAKDMHLTQNAALDLAQRIAKSMDAAEEAEIAETTAKKQADTDALKKDWGANWDANLFVAQRAAQSLGVTAEQLEAAQNMLGYGKVMEMFRGLAAKLGEDKLIMNGGNGGNVTMTPAMANQRKAELLSDPAWSQRYTNGGKKELAEMMALNTIIVGRAA